MDCKALLEIGKGLATYLPGFRRIRKLRTGGSDSPRYCYSVWLRHISMAHASGLSCRPESLAEIGPGDSLGVGLAALLSGTNQYHALDIVPFAATAANLAIFDRLVKLFAAREPIPDDKEFPLIWPRLASYEFPHHILTADRLAAALAPVRVESIRTALQHVGEPREGDVRIAYHVSCTDPRVVPPGSLDLIVSQAVLEHVDDLAGLYRAMWTWLRPGGFMSHTIGFDCHGKARAWNGHWGYSELTWKLIRGRRPALLNRQPYSMHLQHMRDVGFRVVREEIRTDRSGIGRPVLARRFKGMSDDDLTTVAAFVQAVKPADAPAQ